MHIPYYVIFLLGIHGLLAYFYSAEPSQIKLVFSGVMNMTTNSIHFWGHITGIRREKHSLFLCCSRSDKSVYARASKTAAFLLQLILTTSGLYDLLVCICACLGLQVYIFGITHHTYFETYLCYHCTNRCGQEYRWVYYSRHTISIANPSKRF